MKKTNQKKTPLAKCQLIKRGWTETLINKLLGTPDELKPNPHYRSGSQMQLFDAERVKIAEGEKAFIESKQKRATRQAIARKSVNTKRKNLRNKIKQVMVPKLEKVDLLHRAMTNYESTYSREIESVTNEFLERIQVNYLRHVLSDYDHILEGKFGNIGLRDLKWPLKQNILRAIANEYPFLRAECRRQLANSRRNFPGYR